MRVLFFQPGQDHQPWVDDLRACLPGAQVDLWEPGAPAADYAVAWTPPQQLIDQQTRLRALFNIGAGVDRLLALNLPPQLMVVRLDDAGMAVQMAEYVCHALIRHFREFDRYAEQAARKEWIQRPAPTRSGFPVGIMGLGVLGERVAQAVREFDFPVLGWSRTGRRLEGVRCFAGQEGLTAFLAASRVLVCLLPLTEGTRGILCRDHLARLRPGGFVINVARGGLLVDADLLALLDNGHLAGAALDVFHAEPLPATHAFWQHPKIAVTPHVSAQTRRGESIAQIAGKIMALERGEPVAGIVDLARGY